MSATVLGLGLLTGWTARSQAALSMEDHSADYLLQLFTDSDKVSVRSLIGNVSLGVSKNSILALQWNNEKVTVPGVEAPAGSQEAIDAITTASRPISGDAFEDFTKVRNEFTGQLTHGATEVDYYMSSESDYLAQQVGARHSKSFNDEELNVSLGASYGWDRIEPLADDDTQTGNESKTTVHWNAIATRVLTPKTILRLGVEYNIVSGLQHNPYRNVYAGGTNVPERHPDHRHRRDAFLKMNTYLGNRSSIKMAYRFYNDDWGIDSHALEGTLSQYVTHGLFASWQYRYYTQTAADFHRDSYTSTSGVGGYVTGDYRLGPLSSNLFGIALDVGLEAFAVQSEVLRHMGVRLNYERYFNSNNYSASILTTQVAYRF